MAHVFPGFQVVERLYASSRTTIERAVRLSDNALVVVKQSSSDVVAAEALRRAQHEHDVLRALRDAPGVIDVHAVVRDGSHVALILESCGAVIAAVRRRLSTSDVLDVGIQLARSLAYIHAAGIVHRDINPDSIVYDPASRTAKIIDFDSAFRPQPDAEAAAPDAHEGTLHYLAPEQTGRLNRAVDHRADLYALGITLYELFAGQRPFAGDDALAIVHAHLAAQPRRLDEVAPAIPGVIADIVMKLVAKSPEQRYQTASGVHADLERCRHELDEHGRIAPFAVARDDRTMRIELPDPGPARLDPSVRGTLDVAIDRAGIAESVADLLACATSWERPVEDSIERLRRVIATSLENGDAAHAGLAAMLLVVHRHIQGAPFRELLEEARRGRKLCARLGVVEAETWLRWYLAHTRSWTGAPPGPGEADVDFAATERNLLASDRPQTALAMLRALELERRYWCGDARGVVELYHAIAPAMASIPGQLYKAEVHLYYCLAAVAVGDAPDTVEACRADLARYARSCPASFQHMADLVAAELHRARGDVASALASYDAAIDAAAEHGFLKVEAIAHELVAEFWRDRGKPAFAAVHLGKARDVCEHWGARPRARQLELKRRALGPALDTHSSRSTTAVASTLDLATIAKASQAIASDIVLDSLLAKIMDIIIENTGAQAGSIVLSSDDKLRVHASKQPGAAVSVGAGVALADTPDASEGIIKYVIRTVECVVLGDATRHPTFRTDPYVRERRPRSVLCLPILHQGRVIGAVYLENNLVADAFTVDRLEALGILIAQLAMSIENAMMFSRLEELVAERTRALTQANQQLRDEVVARERMESQLRLAQKLQAVGQLAAGVAHEINTPMQYVGDSIAFLKDAVDGLLGLADAYHAAIDPATATLDAQAIARADDDFDLAFLRAHAPAACARAIDGVARVSKIVLAMKAFSHPDHKDQAPTALNAALEDTLVVAHNEYRGVAEIVTELGDIPAVVCHVGELNQVFLNLIVNAAHAIGDVVKHTGKRGTITIRTALDGDDVLITIADTGSGIPDAIRDRVFDPFFTTKDVGRGTGQGLALARTAIVDRHGGSIHFEGRPGGGTTFFVRLPIHGRRAPPIPVAS
jgi:signal transduction histidine kinase